MTRRLIVRPATEEDLDEASKVDEGQREGLGKEFLASVDEALETLAKRPDFGIVVHKRLRRMFGGSPTASSTSSSPTGLSSSASSTAGVPAS